jgi:hypothetical protein
VVELLPGEFVIGRLSSLQRQLKALLNTIELGYSYYASELAY